MVIEAGEKDEEKDAKVLPTTATPERKEGLVYRAVRNHFQFFWNFYSATLEKERRRRKRRKRRRRRTKGVFCLHFCTARGCISSLMKLSLLDVLFPLHQIAQVLCSISMYYLVLVLSNVHLLTCSSSTLLFKVLQMLDHSNTSRHVSFF